MFQRRKSSIKICEASKKLKKINNQIRQRNKMAYQGNF